MRGTMVSVMVQAYGSGTVRAAQNSSPELTLRRWRSILLGSVDLLIKKRKGGNEEMRLGIGKKGGGVSHAGEG